MDDVSIAAYAAATVLAYATGERAGMPNEAGALEALKTAMRRTKSECGVGWRLDTLKKMRKATRTICRKFGLGAMAAQMN
jgi:hypothetical protein